MAQYQTNRASCGPASLVNALAALGVSRTEEEMIRAAGQTVNGTSAKGLRKALADIGGMVNAPLRYTSSDVALLSLWHWISERGRPIILCVDDHEHWVVAVGYLGGRFVLIDSADNRLVLYYDPKELLERWEGPTGGYYGLIV